MKPITKTLFLVSLASIALAGCTASVERNDELYGTNTGGTIDGRGIVIAGSSTVLPLAEVWGEQFGLARGIQVSVSGGGSGAGATRLCAKEIDIGDMSRTMKEAEKATCRANGVEPVQWKVAYDALSVAVSKGNTFVQDLTVAQLRGIFQERNFTTKWSQVDPSFPNTDIKLCYPDSDSGTYEYFAEEILAKGKHRTGTGTQQSSDDNVLVNCLAADSNAIGYFGLAYLTENANKVRAVKVNGVAPSAETVNDGTYRPLSRFIYMYTNGAPRENILSDFLHYVFAPNGGQSFVSDVGYVPLDPTTRGQMLAQLAA
jgi:phosphate transport system substrate-binding protein